MKRTCLMLLVFLWPFASRAAIDPLQAIYESRSDLQQAFDSKTKIAKPDSRAGFLMDLEDWAKQYGWQEYKKELAAYAPATEPPKAGEAKAPKISAGNYIVVDSASGIVLAAEGADEVWPIASITKLMTAQVSLQRGVSLDKTVAMSSGDNVGGAALSVTEGTTFRMNDLLSAMLIGSANNAANAIARSSGPDFIVGMNTRARELHLVNTNFVDASGIDPRNVSTAREVAALAEAAFTFEPIQKNTTTVTKDIQALNEENARRLKSTNWMLSYPEYDDVYVTAGKTGYLEESGWNLVVRLRPSASEKQKELTIVTFNSASRGDSFKDAEALARWVWDDFIY
ncbi:MAG: serine hydrolase [Patescibacteria group bacterium]